MSTDLKKKFEQARASGNMDQAKSIADKAQEAKDKRKEKAAKTIAPLQQEALRLTGSTSSTPMQKATKGLDDNSLHDYFMENHPRIFEKYYTARNSSKSQYQFMKATEAIRKDTTKQNISLHLQNIFEESELDPSATVKKYLIVQTEGSRQVRRTVDHYSLEAILAVGMRVRSARGTVFRQWAIARLGELYHQDS